MNTGRIITTALAASILAIPAMADDAPGYFKIPGTDTTMKVYGSAASQFALETTNHIGIGNALTPSSPHESTQLSDQWVHRTNGDIGITTTTPSPLGDVICKVEFDMREINGAEANGGFNEFDHAYVSIGGLLVGRTSTLFPDGDAAPNCIDTWGMPSDSWFQPGRVTQVRYTFTPTKEITGAIDFEQDKTGVSGIPATVPVGTFQRDQYFPGAIVAALGYASDWGHVRASVAYQKCSYKLLTTTPQVDKSYSGTDLSWCLGANLVLGKGNLTAEVRSGVGYYGSGLKDAFYVNTAGDGFKTEKDVAFQVGYSLAVTDAVTVAGGIGQVKWKKNTDIIDAVDAPLTPVANSASLNNTGYTETSAFLNVQWAATKTTKFAVEYYYATVKAGDTKPYQQHDGNFTDTVKEGRINLNASVNFF